MRKFLKSLTLASITVLSTPFLAHAEEVTKTAGPAFVVHKLTDFLYAIGEPTYYQKNFSYLLVGEKQALMFDAGANQKEDITKVVCGFHADSDTHSTHIRTVIPR